MTHSGHLGYVEYRTLEGICIVRDILGPSRSMDDVLVILRRAGSAGPVPAVERKTRVS